MFATLIHRNAPHFQQQALLLRGTNQEFVSTLIVDQRNVFEEGGEGIDELSLPESNGDDKDQPSDNEKDESSGGSPSTVLPCNTYAADIPRGFPKWCAHWESSLR